MSLLDFWMVLLAAGALVNAWMLRGGLFETWRDWLAVWGNAQHSGLPPERKFRWIVGKLFTCRTCLTYHVAFWMLVVFYIPKTLLLGPSAGVVWFIPVYALAASRLSLLIGTLTAWLDIEGDPEND